MKVPKKMKPFKSKKQIDSVVKELGDRFLTKTSTMINIVVCNILDNYDSYNAASFLLFFDDIATKVIYSKIGSDEENHPRTLNYTALTLIDDVDENRKIVTLTHIVVNKEDSKFIVITKFADENDTSIDVIFDYVIKDNEFIITNGETLDI